MALLIREAFLRGISTRQVGRVIGVITGEVVSAQTVSKISRSLDGMVKAFHQARLSDDWVYLFLDGVSLRVRRPGGRKRVQMLVAYGVRADGRRRLLGFNAARERASRRGKGCWGICIGEGWKARTETDCHRWLCGAGSGSANRLSAGGASTLLGAQDAQYPGVGAEAGLRAVKADAQAIYRAEQVKQAQAAFRDFNGTGRQPILGWSSGWRRTCRSYCRSLLFPSICGGSCGRPT